MIKRRPWRRTAIKLAANMLGSSHSHFHGWWPHLNIEGTAGSHTVFYKGQPVVNLAEIDTLKRLAASEIVIAGSGPSIARTDLKKIPEHSAILLNGALSLTPETVPVPLAIAIEDERFIWAHFPMLRKHAVADIPLILSVTVIRALCEIEPDFLAGRTVILIDDLRKPYGKPKASMGKLASQSFAVVSADQRFGFSRNPGQGVFMGHSVAVSALQFAVALQPEIISFAGVDLSNGSQPRFYEDGRKMEPSSLEGSLGVILGHIALARDNAKSINFRTYSATSALNEIGIPYDDRLTV